MSIPSSRFATQRATLALALLAGLSGCQAPVGVTPSRPSGASSAERNGEIARILELKKRGVTSPDLADAVCLTFGFGGAKKSKAPLKYDLSWVR